MDASRSSVQYNEESIPVKPFLLVSSCLAELLAAFAVAFSILFPRRRIWPPDSFPSWKSGLMGFLFLYPSVGIGILGMIEFGRFRLPLGWRMVLGLPPVLTGLALFLWAAAVLGFGSMVGGGGPMAESGPFRFSRNPQYVGCMLMLIGWTFLSASKAVAAASLFGFLPLALVPFAEESWLRERYGRRYEEYRKKARRFI
jgi:protein-S-isoprenylcysteine O-methyltransferase Ste14